MVVLSVFAGVGERTREGNDLLREMLEVGNYKIWRRLLTFNGRRRLGFI